MPRIICHHESRFNLYSTISDTFVFRCSITLCQLKKYIKYAEGAEGAIGLRALNEPIKRAVYSGTSFTWHDDLDDLLTENRAGQDEATLSTEECIDRFLS